MPSDYDPLHEYERIPRVEFDKLCDEKWADGPFRCSLGDGYGEPYRPYRDLWGTLASGRKVRSSTDPMWKESVPDAK